MLSDERTLKRQVLSGTTWNVIAQIGQQAAHFALSVVLARLLLPEEFGIVGMVTVFTGFVSWTMNSFASSLVQRLELTEQHIHSVFWMNIAMGGLFTLVMFAAAPLITEFYDLPLLLPVTRILSLSFMVSVAGLVPKALLQRRMQFRTLAVINILSVVSSGTAAIICAALGAKVWSLVVQIYLSLAVMTVGNMLGAQWRPHALFSRAAIRDIWGYSINLFAHTAVGYWARTADNLLVGRFFGSAALGYYSRAYALMLLPTFRIVNVVASVMFPALSSIQNDPSRVRQIYRRALSVIALVVCPLMTGLIVTAEPFVLAVYGPTWAPMIPLVQILSLIGLLQALTSPGSWLFTALGRTDWMFRWGVLTNGTLLASIFVGAALGSLQSLAWSYAVANVLLFLPSIAVPCRLMQLNAGQTIQPALAPAVGAGLMAGVVLGVAALLPDEGSSLVELVVLAGVGAAFYAAFVFVIRPAGWIEVRDIVGAQRLSRRLLVRGWRVP